MAMRALIRNALVALALIVALVSAAHAQPIPERTGRVVDAAGILDADTQMRLDNRLASLEARTGDQLVVVTLPSLHGIPIEQYSNAISDAWALGQPGKF